MCSRQEKISTSDAQRAAEPTQYRTGPVVHTAGATITDNPLHVAASNLTASSQRLSHNNNGTLESSAAVAAVPRTLKEVLKKASLEQ